MKLICLLHHDTEMPAAIENWVAERNYQMTNVFLHKAGELPTFDSFDGMIIMGGPMSVYEEDKYPWLKGEKQYIKQAIDANKWVLGVCLGSQLMANALGAKVYPNEHIEIGWLPIEISKEVKGSTFKGFPDKFTTFHWHGDTYDIPDGAVHLAKSDSCLNQGFVYGKRVVAVQFHLEANAEVMKHVVASVLADKPEGKYVQNIAELEQGLVNFSQERLNTFLDNWLAN